MATPYWWRVTPRLCDRWVDLVGRRAGRDGKIPGMTHADPTPRAAVIPDKPSLDGLEDKWGRVWAEQGTYRFDRAVATERGLEAVFSIDTPPPTASGSLHMGHVFSYTHT